jgi:hypothetical protein
MSATDYYAGKAVACVYRWFCNEPGRYLVSLQAHFGYGYSESAAPFCHNFNAVVDDFGNLVEVQ